MRVRLIFSKTGALRYIGHLDLQTLWERAARRAGLPLAYSHGFHPQAKITFASALPLGFSSRAEVMDLRLLDDMELTRLPTVLKPALPEGITILDVSQVDEAEPALQMQIRSAEYEVTLKENKDPTELQRGIDRILAAESLPRERRGKTYDLRPLIEHLSLQSAGAGETNTVLMRLSAREGATGRPEEVLAQMELSVKDVRIERSRLIFQS